MLRVVPDGNVGPRTLQAVNESDAYIFWSHLKESRRRYFLRLVQQHPSQHRFLRGWLRRLSDLSFE
jgi:lysozyme family protein